MLFLAAPEGFFLDSPLFDLELTEDRVPADIDLVPLGFETAQGTLTLANGETRSIVTLPGDYRGIYANLRQAILGKAPLAVTPQDAWRTARILELARQSSQSNQRLPVDLTHQP